MSIIICRARTYALSCALIRVTLIGAHPNHCSLLWYKCIALLHSWEMHTHTGTPGLMRTAKLVRWSQTQIVSSFVLLKTLQPRADHEPFHSPLQDRISSNCSRWGLVHPQVGTGYWLRTQSDSPRSHSRVYRHHPRPAIAWKRQPMYSVVRIQSVYTVTMFAYLVSIEWNIWGISQ